jgi:hypothetical protein
LPTNLLNVAIAAVVSQATGFFGKVLSQPNHLRSYALIHCSNSDS